MFSCVSGCHASERLIGHGLDEVAGEQDHAAQAFPPTGVEDDQCDEERGDKRQPGISREVCQTGEYTGGNQPRRAFVPPSPAFDSSLDFAGFFPRVIEQAFKRQVEHP